jgi:hypothetical protein
MSPVLSEQKITGSATGACPEPVQYNLYLILIYLIIVKHTQSFFLSRGQSYFGTDCPSASLSWCRAPSGTHDHILSRKNDCYSVSRHVASSLTSCGVFFYDMARLSVVYLCLCHIHTHLHIIVYK